MTGKSNNLDAIQNPRHIVPDFSFYELTKFQAIRVLFVSSFTVWPIHFTLDVGDVNSFQPV
jgi:hypothetical protein